MHRFYYDVKNAVSIYNELVDNDTLNIIDTTVMPCEVRIIIKSTLDPSTLNDGKGEHIKPEMEYLDVIFIEVTPVEHTNDDIRTLRANTISQTFKSFKQIHKYYVRDLLRCTNLEHRMHNQILRPQHEV